MFGLVDLEILFGEAQFSEIPLQRVVDRTERIDPVDVVPEAVGPRFREALHPFAGRPHRVVTRTAALEGREDLLEGGASNPSFARRSQHEAPVPVPLDHPPLFEGGEELLEIDVGIDIALLLELPHPVHRLFDIARCGQEELLEGLEEVETGRQPAEEVGVEPAVAVPQWISSPRRTPCGRSSWNFTASL